MCACAGVIHPESGLAGLLANCPTVCIVAISHSLLAGQRTKPIHSVGCWAWQNSIEFRAKSLAFSTRRFRCATTSASAGTQCRQKKEHLSFSPYMQQPSHRFSLLWNQTETETTRKHMREPWITMKTPIETVQSWDRASLQLVDLHNGLRSRHLHTGFFSQIPPMKKYWL